MKNNINNQNERKKKPKVGHRIYGRQLIEGVGDNFQYTKKLSRVIIMVNKDQYIL